LRQELTQVVDLNGEGLSELFNLCLRSLLSVNCKRALIAFAFDRSTDNRIFAESWAPSQFNLDTGLSATVFDELARIFRSA
jgi:hypothetical protein